MRLAAVLEWRHDRACRRRRRRRVRRLDRASTCCSAGHRVTLIDADGPAHSRASSGGESRLTRAAYGKDAIYTPDGAGFACRMEGAERRLGPADLPPMRHPVLLPDRAALSRATPSRCTARSACRPRCWTAPRNGPPLPDDRFRGDRRSGLFEPDFGALMARRAVQTLVDRFVRAGGDYLQAQLARPPQVATAHCIDRSRSRRATDLAADRFVFAARPLAAASSSPTSSAGGSCATRQEVFFFAPPSRRPALPARCNARLGRLQPRRHVLRLSRPRRAAASSSPTTCTGPTVDPDTQRPPADARPRSPRSIAYPRPPLPGCCAARR